MLVSILALPSLFQRENTSYLVMIVWYLVIADMLVLLKQKISLERPNSVSGHSNVSEHFKNTKRPRNINLSLFSFYSE